MHRSNEGTRPRGGASACRAGVIAAVAAFVLQVAPPALADDAATAREIGIGVASGAATLLYCPVKLAYSAVGAVVGGLAYGLSGGDSDVAWAVLTPAVRGDYYVTPDHLRGEKPLEFFGRDPNYKEGEYVLDLP